MKRSKHVPSYRLNTLPESYEELETLYLRIAKQADARLRKLERSGVDGATSYAYKRAMDKIAIAESAVGAKPSNRFNRKSLLPQGRGRVNALKARIRDVQAFMNMQTSTVKGVEAHTTNMTESINSKFGTNFTEKELGDFFRSAFWKKIKSEGYGSDEILVIIGELQKKEITKEDLEELIRGNNDEDKFDFLETWDQNDLKIVHSHKTKVRTGEKTKTGKWKYRTKKTDIIGNSLMRNFEKLMNNDSDREMLYSIL